MKSMHAFKSYWAETKSVTTTTRTDIMILMCLPGYAGDIKHTALNYEKTKTNDISQKKKKHSQEA